MIDTVLKQSQDDTDRKRLRKFSDYANPNIFLTGAISKGFNHADAVVESDVFNVSQSHMLPKH